MLERVASLLSHRGAYEEAERHYTRRSSWEGSCGPSERWDGYHGLAGLSMQAAT